MVYYIGSDKSLPLIKGQNWDAVDTKKEGWETNVVPFSVESLDENNEIVKEQFAHKFVYYAGSFLGCGCGFNASVWDEYGDNEEDCYFSAGIESRRQLRIYIYPSSFLCLLLLVRRRKSCSFKKD